MTVALRISTTNVESTDADGRVGGARTGARAVARRRRPLDPRPPGARGRSRAARTAFWLAGYPAACAGLALLLRARVRGSLGPTMWLDGAIAAAAVASLVAAASPGRGARRARVPARRRRCCCAWPPARPRCSAAAPGARSCSSPPAWRCARVADAARLLEGVEVARAAGRARARLRRRAARPRPAAARRPSAAPTSACPPRSRSPRSACCCGTARSRRSAARRSTSRWRSRSCSCCGSRVSLRENNRLLERSRDEALTDASPASATGAR